MTSFAYRCPDCAGKFTWRRGDAPPDRCPLCSAWVSEDEPEEFVPKAPAIRKSPYTKSVDQTYRAMESASIERAEEAGGILESAYASQPKDEYEGLVRQTQKEEIAKLKSETKITNMRDPSQMREGDAAHIPKSGGEVTGAFQSFGGRPAESPHITPGIGGGRTPLDNVRNSMTSNHHARAAAVSRAGNMGRYTPQ